MSNTTFIFIHGNIGAGKTTYIEKVLTPEDIFLKEDISKWGDRFTKYYEAINKKKRGEEDLYNIIEFERNLFQVRLDQYKEVINSNKTIYVERSLAESYYIFINNLKSYFDGYENLYLYMCLQLCLILQEATDLLSKYKVKHIFLREDVDVLYKRINKRARKDEEVSKEYLEQLQTLYDKYQKQLELK